MNKRTADALFCVMLAFMAVFPLMHLFCGSFGIECTPGLLIFTAAACAVSCGFWLLPRLWYVFAALLAALLLAPVLGHTAELAQSTRSFFSRVCEVYDGVFPQLGLKYVPGEGECTRFMFIFSLVLAFVVSMAVTSPHGAVFFSFAATLPFFIAAIIVNSYPSAASIFFLSLFYALTLASRFGRAGALAAALPLGLTLLLIMLRVGPSDFAGDKAQAALAARFDAVSERVMTLLGRSEEPVQISRPTAAPGSEPTPSPTPVPSVQPSKAPAASGLPAAYTEGDMTLRVSGVGAPNTTGGTVMRVRSTLGGLMYLRSYSLGGYTGSGWKRGESRGSSLGFAHDAALSLGASEHTAEIERVGDVSGLRHTPYYADAEGDCCSYTDRSRYTVTFLTCGTSLTEAQLDSAEERDYREWVYSTYTALPDGEREKMLELADSAGISPGGDVVSLVAEYISTCAQYDLSAPPAPEGEDCAVYFLTVSRRGFCIHFATAAAVMYRALGVPARVVSGFMFTARKDEWVSVTDKNAHAWVEVYIDGVGWIPVEVTGSAAAPYAPDNAPQELNRTAQRPSPGVISPEEGRASPAAGTALCIILCCALLAASAVLRRAAALRRRERRFGARDPSYAVCAMWSSAAAFARFGISPPEELRTLAERAYYSKAGVTDAERARARGILRSFYADAEEHLKKPALFAAKYIFALL